MSNLPNDYVQSTGTDPIMKDMMGSDALTLRDRFAAAVLTGILAGPGTVGMHPEEIAYRWPTLCLKRGTHETKTNVA